MCLVRGTVSRGGARNRRSREVRARWQLISDQDAMPTRHEVP